jgi:hypothetical protein
MHGVELKTQNRSSCSNRCEYLEEILFREGCGLSQVAKVERMEFPSPGCKINRYE